MSEQRNIVILGASFSGLQTTHYFFKHILPSLKAKNDAKYHVYLINPSSDFYMRPAAVRTAASTDRLPTEKVIRDLNEEGFKQYSSSEFTFIIGTATGLDTAARTVTYKRSEYLGDEQLKYHALVIATGSKTHDPVFSMHTDTPALVNAIKTRNTKLKSAKDIIIVGGGPTAVEHAGEIGDLLNGKPGWFSTPPRKVNITIITAGSQLLPQLRPAIGKQAEGKLKKLGVDVVYNTRVADVSTGKNGRTTVTLAKGEKLEADLYIPAHGVLPNSSFVPDALLTDTGYIKTNASTTRVDAAGPRVYAYGDVASNTRNTIVDVYDSFPALVINLKRDLLSYNPNNPDAKPKGKDREFKPNLKNTQIVPIGTAGGVGEIYGWRLPNWAVWLIKARNFMIDIVTPPLLNGDKVSKEIKWTNEEAVV